MSLVRVSPLAESLAAVPQRRVHGHFTRRTLIFRFKVRANKNGQLLRGTKSMASATSGVDSHDLSSFSAVLVTPHSAITIEDSHPPLHSLTTYGAAAQSRCALCTGNKMAAGQEEDADFIHLANLADPLAFDVLVLLLQV